MTAVMSAATAVVRRWLAMAAHEPAVTGEEQQRDEGARQGERQHDLAPDERARRVDAEPEDDERRHDGHQAPEERRDRSATEAGHDDVARLHPDERRGQPRGEQRDGEHGRGDLTRVGGEGGIRRLDARPGLARQVRREDDEADVRRPRDGHGDDDAAHGAPPGAEASRPVTPPPTRRRALSRLRNGSAGRAASRWPRRCRRRAGRPTSRAGSARPSAAGRRGRRRR